MTHLTSAVWPAHVELDTRVLHTRLVLIDLVRHLHDQ